jgi:MFS family permease
VPRPADGGRAADGGTVPGGVPDLPARPGKGLGPAFWRLWWAMGISGSGDGLVIVALPLLTLTLTRSPLVIAGVTAVNRGARAIAALPAGVLADRVDRRRLMVICSLISAVALGLLALDMTLGYHQLAAIYVAAAVLSVSDVTDNLATQAFVPDVVATEQLAAANGRLMSVDTAGENFVGPGVGGALFAFARRLPFVGDAISFVVAALLASLSFPVGDASRPVGRAATLASRPRTPGAPLHCRPGWISDFKEGIAVFRRERALQLLAASMASIAFAQFVVFALQVVYGTRVLHLTSAGYGLFVALSGGLGVIAGYLAGPLNKKVGPGPMIVAGSVLASVSFIGLSVTRSWVVAVFVLGLQDFGVVLASVGSVTTRQHLVPRHLYGRVVGVHRTLVAAAAPLGALFGGLVASLFSVQLAFAVAGVFNLVMLAVLGPPMARSLTATLANVRTLDAPS